MDDQEEKERDYNIKLASLEYANKYSTSTTDLLRNAKCIYEYLTNTKSQ